MYSKNNLFPLLLLQIITQQTAKIKLFSTKSTPGFCYKTKSKFKLQQGRWGRTWCYELVTNFNLFILLHLHRGGAVPATGNSLYDEAVALVVREQKASTSFVQRHLKIGYNRAATLIEEMESAGIISAANHVGKLIFNLLKIEHGLKDLLIIKLVLMEFRYYL